MPVEDHDALGLDALHRLNDVVVRLNSLETTEETLHAVADGVVDVVGFEVAVVSLLHTDQMLETVAVAGSEQARAELLGTRTPLADLTREFDVAEEWGPLRFVPHENIPEGPVVGWVPDIDVPDVDNAWHPLDALYAPLRDVESNLVGILSVDLPRDRRRPGRIERELLTIFASHAGIAINNARVASRLRISEETFRLAFDASGVGMTLIALNGEPSGRILQANPAFCRLLGYAPEDLINASVLDVTHPDDRPNDRLALDRMRSGTKIEHKEQKRYVRSDGTSTWVSIHSTALTNGSDTPTSAMTVVEDISERRRRHLELTHLVEHDELTGLPNRRVLFSTIAGAIERARNDGVSGALLFCDLDGFKNVNDAYGHAVGDRVLAVVANRIASTIRKRDVVIRVGGDEFVVIADAITARQGRRLIRRLSTTIPDPVTSGESNVRVHISIGMTEISPDGPSDPDQILRAADDAMYEQKQAQKQAAERSNPRPPQNAGPEGHLTTS